jgi:hypothetical protein
MVAGGSNLQVSLAGRVALDTLPDAPGREGLLIAPPLLVQRARGDVIMVRYADDAVLGFENRDEAEAFRRELEEQLQRVGLELHPQKTRLMEFGRYAEPNRKRRGEGKPETFDFLGFTHMCGRTRTAGRFTARRKTIGKRMRAKLQQIRQKLRQRMHESVPETGKWLRSVAQGYFNYHAVPGQRAGTVGFP